MQMVVELTSARVDLGVRDCDVGEIDVNVVKLVPELMLVLRIVMLVR